MTVNNSPLIRSLDLDHNKFVRASAGAGKTFALSKRYCHIIDDFAGQSSGKDQKHWLGVRNILVITFTRKAAAEMATRIYDDLNNLIDGKEIEDLSNQGIELGTNLSSASPEYKLWLKSSFTENYISTIDGFCSRILRENAHLIDIDPGFKIQDEFESRMLFDEVLEDFMNRLSADFDPELKLVMESASLQKVRQYVKYFSDNRVFISDWMDFMERTDEDEVGRIWIEKYTPEFDENRVIRELEKILEFEQAGVKDVNDRGWVLLLELRKNMEALARIPEGVCRRHFIITGILPLFRTKSDEFFKGKGIPGATGKWKNPVLCKEFKDTVKEFIGEVSEILTNEQITGTPGKADLDAVPILKSLINIYSRFDDELTEQKNRLNQMTYNDLLFTTLKMLKEHEGIRQKYSRRFKHIMVDEFQDTNDLRWEIIRTFAEENGRLRRKGFFIVGDKKQSIYGFQQADVEVMEEAERILSENEPNPEDVLIDFNGNFRSSEQFIKKAINPFFGKLIPDSSQSDEIAPYEVIFDPAEYGARTGEGELERKRIGEHTESCIDIRASYLCKDEIDEVPSDEYIPAMNAALAVKEMLEWSDEVEINETPVIAVLLRKFTKIQQYIKIFNLFDIPFEIIGGRGLFEQQEAFDIFHLVSVIINPHDDYALVGLLRSPVFAVPDTLVHEIFQGKGSDQSVYDYLSDNESTIQIKATIDQWIQMSGIYPLDRLLRDILAGGYTVLGYFSESLGQQRIANLDRLLHIIHSAGMNGMSAVGIYEKMKYLLENPEGGSQAELPSSVKVQIMTIHKSKGLQFPIVIIPELNEAPKSDTSVIAHGKIDGKVTEVGISINDARGDAMKTGFIDAIKKLAKNKSDAEELRLLYVAVTRAKYRVCLLGDVKYDQKLFQNWWNRFIVGHGFFIDSKTLYEMDEEGKIDRITDYYLISRRQLIEKLLKYKKSVIEKISWEEPPRHQEFRHFWEVNPHIIMNSIPSPDGHQYNTAISNSGKSGIALGALFHKVVEKEWFDIVRYKEKINEFIDNEIQESNRKELTDKLDNLVDKYLQSERYRIISQVPAGDKYVEHEVIGWLENRDMVLQVSGRVDLLYKYNDQWFVLDYKTDVGKDRLESYKVQIRTYIWMLRQMYGIEAQGQIYFAGYGETINVEWDDDYFDKIFPLEHHPFKMHYPSNSTRNKTIKSIGTVIRENTDKPITIINQTKQQALDLYKGLMSADNRILNPKVRISTYQDLFISHEVQGRKISSSVSRMIIARLVAERGKDNSKRGLIDKINKAILESEYSRSVLTHFTDIQKDFKEFKQKESFFTNYDIASDFLNNCDFSGKIVMLNGFFNHRPIDFEIIENIRSSADKFYFINNFNEDGIDKEFNIEQNIWSGRALIPPDTSNRRYYVCFSVDDEVEKAANYIVNLDRWQERLDSIVIAVSSMERYVPSIKRIFTDFGIPTTIAKNEPVIERPIVSLVLGLLNIMADGGKKKTSDIMNAVLNPLMKPDRRLYKFDHQLHNLGIEYWHQLENYFSDTTSGKETISDFRDVFEKINNIYTHDIKISGSKDAFTASDKIKNFINKYNLRNSLKHDQLNSGALSKIFDLLDQIPKSFRMVGLPGSFADFREEFTEQVKEVEVPTKVQEMGIRVLGTLDTVHLEPEVLLVLGMTEDLFPRNTEENSLIVERGTDNWFIDLGILKRWLELESEIVFLAPERDENGEPLRISTFIEYFQEKTALESKANTSSKRAHFKQYSGMYIDYHGQKEILRRHNDYLAREAKSIFKGCIGSTGTKELSLSSTGMDSLLHCPMRYWFERILRLKKIGYDEELEARLMLGNVVHSILERFGKSGGFAVLKDNFINACTMMNYKLLEVFEEYKIDPELNLSNLERYRLLRNGLREGSDDNIFVELLRWNEKLFEDLNAEYFEKVFGESEDDRENWDSAVLSDDKIRMSFHGKIDKVMISEDESIVLATDYKTGNINIRDNIELWTSQLPVYYFALKQKYPDSKVLLAYEQMKSLKHSDYGVSSIFGDRYNDYGDSIIQIHLHDEKYTDKNLRSKDKLSVAIDNLVGHYLDLGKKVLGGEFHIAERELHGKACKYCDFSRICRKDCVVV